MKAGVAWVWEGGILMWGPHQLLPLEGKDMLPCTRQLLWSAGAGVRHQARLPMPGGCCRSQLSFTHTLSLWSLELWRFGCHFSYTFQQQHRARWEPSNEVSWQSPSSLGGGPGEPSLHLYPPEQGPWKKLPEQKERLHHTRPSGTPVRAGTTVRSSSRSCEVPAANIPRGRTTL